MARRWVVLVLVALAVAAAWFFLGRTLGGPKEVAEVLRGWGLTPMGLVLVPLGLAFALLIFVPITALLVGCALVFTPLQAFGFAMSGAVLGAALNWVLGRLVAGPLLESLKGEKWVRLTRQLQQRPFRATVVMRFFPVGGFSLLNLFAGAVRVPFVGYMLGNVVGILPAAAFITLLGGQLPGLFEKPNAFQIVGIVLGVIAVVVVTIFIRKWAMGDGDGEGEKA